MELSSVFGGDSLKAADLQGTEPTVTIASVEQKKFDNGNKLILKFVGKKKALVANKTNSKRIGMMYGTNTDAWVGKPVTLYVDIVDFQGEPTEAIRIRVQRQSVAQPARQIEEDRVPDPISSGIGERGQQQPMRRTVDPDDEIPF